MATRTPSTATISRTGARPTTATWRSSAARPGSAEPRPGLCRNDGHLGRPVRAPGLHVRRRRRHGRRWRQRTVGHEPGQTGLYVLEGNTNMRIGNYEVEEDAIITYTWRESDPLPTSIRSIGDWSGDGVAEIAVGVGSEVPERARSGCSVPRTARVSSQPAMPGPPSRGRTTQTRAPTRWHSARRLQTGRRTTTVMAATTSSSATTSGATRVPLRARRSDHSVRRLLNRSRTSR